MRKLKLRNKLSAKQKEKLINIIAVSVLILFLISIAGYFAFDIRRTKKHMEECRRLCHPAEMIENLSFKHCVCKKTLSIEDTI